MNTQKLAEIRIDRSQRQRRQGPFWTILLLVLAITLVAAYFAWPGKSEERRVMDTRSASERKAATPPPAQANPEPRATPSGTASDVVLTVSGYIVNHERIELSPRFQDTVTWIGVKKGDRVTKDQIVVTLEDTEQKARLLEAEGHLASAKASLEKADLNYARVKKLRETRVESEQLEDDARVQRDSARAAVKEAEGGYAYAKSQVDWTVIRAPIDGVVLEKLVDPGELVTPLSFGGTRGPSTAFMALADPNDLQVEIDVNESDLPKIRLGQKCRVSPEAYPDKIYDGFVAEIAPEANRQKGTLQLKVQIEKPDQFLTPELSAKVDFLKK